MSNILLYVLFLFVPLIHSSFLNYFWFNFNSLVDWNFEFTKVIFFNIISWLAIISFLIERAYQKLSIKIYYKKTILFIVFLSILSTYLSISPFISLFWNKEKAHSLILFLNLIWIFVVLTNKKHKELNNLLNSFLYSMLFVWIIWIKEYYFPSLWYQSVVSKAVSSLWNNQYFALSLVLLIPLILKKYTTIYKYIALIFLFFCLILTKSFIWFFIFTIYLFFYLFWRKRWLFVSIISLFIWSILVFLYFPEKLHSFLSRFYIWENVIKLSFSSFKSIIIWNLYETLSMLFPKEKNPYLYIYENYGFIADRSHNLWIDILYSTWMFWFILSIYSTYKILKITKNTYFFDTFLIFFVFCFFNFSWITQYLYLVLILSVFIVKKWEKLDLIKIKSNYLILPISIFCIFSIYYSSMFFIAEYYYKKWNLIKSIDYFPYPNYYFKSWEYDKWLKNYSIIPLNYYKNKINRESYDNLLKNCRNLVNKYNIAENYFFCWDLLKKSNHKKESLLFIKNDFLCFQIYTMIIQSIIITLLSKKQLLKIDF